MATTMEPPGSGDGLLDAEEIGLEPTIAVGRADLDAPSAPAHAAASLDATAAPRMGLVAGSLASLRGETRALRRRRLSAAALFLAVAYGLFLAFYFATREEFGGVFPLLLGLRMALAIAAAALLFSRLDLGPGGVKAVEYTLFGGMTILLAISQYHTNLDFLRVGNTAAVIAMQKNGVIQLVILMVLYGMIIPNDARAAARAILTILLIPLAGMALLAERPDVAQMVARLRTTEPAGTNALILLIGAVLAIYGAYALNGLRTELHAARRLGQYQLRELIGAGGMGEVYFAEHQLLKRPCALKLIRPEAGADPIALARFEREVQSAARLSHPNTIEIFDYGHADDGTFYYVMEFLPGMSLADLVRQFGPLPPGRAIYLLRQACAGLAEAHNLGLVHRDLKPANVFVAIRGGEYDVTKVLDFGLVKLTRDPGAPELTTDQTVSGTPLFMAPEQAAGHRDLGPSADIYALGAVAYFTLTGRPPFLGDTALAVMIAHARDLVEPPSRYQPGLPADLEAVVLRCLAKSPADRFPDVRSLSRALASCASAADWDAECAEQWWIAAARAHGQAPAGDEVGAPAAS